MWVPVSSEELGEMYFEAPGTALSSALEMDTVTTDVYSKLRNWQTGEIMDTNTNKPGNTGYIYREPDILTSTEQDLEGDAAASNLATIKSVFATEIRCAGFKCMGADVGR